MDKFAFRRKIEKLKGNLIEAFQKKNACFVILPLFYYNDLWARDNVPKTKLVNIFILEIVIFTCKLTAV